MVQLLFGEALTRLPGWSSIFPSILTSIEGDRDRQPEETAGALSRGNGKTAFGAPAPDRPS
jgi:hypothetical protein